MTPATREALRLLAAIPTVHVLSDEPLARHTRFALGGPADLLAESAGEEGFVAALRLARTMLPHAVIGGGTNLIVAGAGFRGAVLRFAGARIEADGNTVTAQAGAGLQDLVDFTISRGLGGLETLAGIPGSVGGAIYGNAGAYGHSISEYVVSVRSFDGGEVRAVGNPECGFRYRESIFKQRKDWVITAVDLRLAGGDRSALRSEADRIIEIRNAKFPPAMKCAGSIFKNPLAATLPGAASAAAPPAVTRDGKIPAAWFLDQAGARGLVNGGIRVADYHANLVYNTGSGTSLELCELIREMKSRVRARFGFDLDEEVQFIGCQETGA